MTWYNKMIFYVISSCRRWRGGGENRARGRREGRRRYHQGPYRVSTTIFYSTLLFSINYYDRFPILIVFYWPSLPPSLFLFLCHQIFRYLIHISLSFLYLLIYLSFHYLSFLYPLSTSLSTISLSSISLSISLSTISLSSTSLSTSLSSISLSSISLSISPYLCLPPSLLIISWLTTTLPPPCHFSLRWPVGPQNGTRMQSALCLTTSQ